jgi:hypothetical protein
MHEHPAETRELLSRRGRVTPYADNESQSSCSRERFFAEARKPDDGDAGSIVEEG